MSLELQIIFDGTCRQATQFYAEVFESEQPKYITFGDTEADIPEKYRNHILFTEVTIQDKKVVFSDTPPSMRLVTGNNITITLTFDTWQKLEKTFGLLSEGGKVDMPLEEVSGSQCCGCVTDKFGLMWQLTILQEE